MLTLILIYLLHFNVCVFPYVLPVQRRGACCLTMLPGLG